MQITAIKTFLQRDGNRLRWGLEIDPRALKHWERKLPGKPDGPTGYT